MGIGRAAAVKLARQGAHVLVTDLVGSGRASERWEAGDDLAELEETASLCRQHGVTAFATDVDVTDPAAVSACVDLAMARLGGVDLVFNNAGVPTGVGAFLDMADARWDLSWQVNVMGMVRMCRAVIPHMRTRGGGAIVNNASVAALGAVGDFAAYTTTKFAVIGLTKSIAVDFGPDRIRCNAVCPGLIETLMGRYEQELFGRRWAVPPDEARRRLAEEVPLRRWGTPGEVADAVAYLMGPEAAYVNGVALPVAGGLAPGL
jgi:3-oxoacyl-[acyl-carrier protein] reductase